MTDVRDIAARTRQLFDEHRLTIARRTDRLFAYLMTLQFAAGIIFALLISPRAWEGAQSHVHIHVWAALLLGGLIGVVPVVIAMLQPGRFSTRCTIAVGQMLTSALLIHLTGGRIETHFHVFGSLAFLAFYRDWRVFIPATLVVGLDHLIRGVFWPQSVYGVMTATPWRSAEHAAWVVFENIFLVRACVQSVREMRQIAEKRAELEATNARVEAKVRERTAELNAQKQTLEEEICVRQRAEAEREVLHAKLLDASRKAGMAEVATGVLHNVGNVLNSVNVSVSVMADAVRQSRVSGLTRAAGLFRDHTSDLGSFLTSDSKGKLLPGYLVDLAKHMSDEQRMLLDELTGLARNVEHIKSIVATQQSYARAAGVIESVHVTHLIDDALRMAGDSLEKCGVDIVREFEDIPPVRTDKHRLLQILVNLVGNARHAMEGPAIVTRRLTLRAVVQDVHVRIEVSDTGEGIPEANLTKIFAHGFTTREKGHGFGLHSSALAAQSMGGSLTAQSAGPGRGASFILELPLEPMEATA